VMKVPRFQHSPWVQNVPVPPESTEALTRPKGLSRPSAKVPGVNAMDDDLPAARLNFKLKRVASQF
jgi:hypothetical protein